MNILQINSVCGSGSTGRIASDIHSILVEQGHRSTVAYGRDSPRGCENTVRVGNQMDIYCHGIKTRLLDQHGFGSKRATRDFLNEIRNINPDVIHLHNIHGYYLNIEVLFDYLKESNKPVIWTLHDCWPFTGHCAYFDFVNCEKWRTECMDCPQTRKYPSSIVFDNSKQNFHRKKKIFSGVESLTIVTPSEWLGHLVKESFLKEYGISVINNGIDLEIFRPTRDKSIENLGICEKFVILGVANVWEERKGLDFFENLHTQREEDEIIVVVGLTEEQKRNLPKGIVGISRTNSVRELAALYTSADVFVNPTLEDNFPTTNLEALACGTPVVTFNTGGSPESISDDTGFVVEKGSLTGLLSSIRKVKALGKIQFAEKCSARARELFDKNKRYNDYIELYKKGRGKAV